MSFSSSQELQIHVNAKHMDILSPDKSSRWSDGTDRNYSEDIHICPMCDEEFNETALLEIHVNGHFSAEQTPGNQLFSFIQLKLSPAKVAALKMII
jgi:hypothetical protein